MATGFYGSPVLATRHPNAAYGVHDAFVVRCCPVGVVDGEGLGLKDAVDDAHAVFVCAVR